MLVVMTYPVFVVLYQLYTYPPSSAGISPYQDGQANRRYQPCVRPFIWICNPQMLRPAHMSPKTFGRPARRDYHFNTPYSYVQIDCDTIVSPDPI